jgi:hypothetical protein
MYQVLDKDTIEKEIMPHLSLAKPGQTHLIFIVNLQRSYIFPKKTAYGKS